VRNRGDEPAGIIEHVTAWIGRFLKRIWEKVVDLVSDLQVASGPVPVVGALLTRMAARAAGSVVSPTMLGPELSSNMSMSPT
jgi:hypothetical protein